MKAQDRVLHLEQFDLQDLQVLKGKAWSDLDEIHLNRNMLNNIDMISRFQNLRVIDASNNYIEEVALHSLQKLERLDLSNNYLKKFP